MKRDMWEQTSLKVINPQALNVFVQRSNRLKIEAHLQLIVFKGWVFSLFIEMTWKYEQTGDGRAAIKY